jgi:hypothetical protein
MQVHVDCADMDAIPGGHDRDLEGSPSRIIAELTTEDAKPLS